MLSNLCVDELMRCMQIYLYIFTVTLGNLSSPFTRMSVAVLHHDGDILAVMRASVSSLSVLIRHIQSDKLQTSVVTYFRKKLCIASNFSESILKESRGHEHIKSLKYLFTFFAL